jgi:hypothetical protein
MDSNLQFRAKWAAASRLLRDDQARLSGGEAGVALHALGKSPISRWAPERFGGPAKSRFLVCEGLEVTGGS